MTQSPIIEREQGSANHFSLLQVALQRWENEGGAGPGRQPTELIFDEVRPDDGASTDAEPL